MTSDLKLIELDQVMSAWQPGPADASGFCKKLGFVETGEMLDDEVVAAMRL